MIPPKKKVTKTTSWGRVAAWYDELLSKEGTFQKEVILPALLATFKKRKAKTVIDIGCGTGFFSRALHDLGISVTGVDVAPELIEIARKESPKEITFKVAAAEDLKLFADESFDAAVMILAVQNMHAAGKAFAEASRVLKHRGRLIIVLNHPCYRIPNGSGWEFVENDVQFRRVDRYLTPFEVQIDMHPGIAPREVTTSFHRPLSFYVNALSAAGMAVTGLDELISHKNSDSGPRAKAENIARNEIPLFMQIEAVKL